MSFIAEFAIEIPPLAEASKAVPEMRFTGEDIVLAGERPRKFVFTAHGTEFDAFEAALDADPTVARYSTFTRLAEHAFYVVTYRDDVETRGTYHVAVEEDVAYVSVELQDGTYFVRARVPERDALASIREHCRANDIPFTMERIYREGPGNAGTHQLTDVQRETLLLAYERGYFDSPRETTLESIADELDVSRQAVADRLRRGHKRLLEETIL